MLFKVVQDALASEVVRQGITNTAEMKEFVRDWTTAFYGSFFFWVNVTALVLQALQDHGIANAPLMIFALAATVLVLFMLRT